MSSVPSSSNVDENANWQLQDKKIAGKMKPASHLEAEIVPEKDNSPSV